MHDVRAFVADVGSPASLRLHLSHTGIQQSSFGSFDWLGWELVVNKLSDGEEQRFRDHWEATMLQALALANSYSNELLLWRLEGSAEVVDVSGLQPAYDASRRFQTAIRTDVSSDSANRLCINAYDDGRYRYTHEQLIVNGNLRAWVARRWSQAHTDLLGAEKEARLAFDWFD